ncbi:quinol:cytochrome c oxidoreductase membrane protein [Candidatus Koribacter versatilis Ellin345]|uniref:Quinol:cytochrome c oxidoreductase membrane protein n=1 Tax=Koribacter versatilis (strain Ellin345) TaxID=204669 RepID=Q1IM98_KORVE|nr:DUF3341 domain-containing protein [Candidatus Koribacter versatilis]ABF42002.1 quinol:cytochrome c oxidoreductase membrane protein [Candidatus Koribacter versatilis Ellin345]
MEHAPATPIYGLMAEFDDIGSLLNAAKKAYAAGYRQMDAYSPFPNEELSDAIGFPKTRVPLIVLIGGIMGGLSAFALQYWCSAISYPVVVAGRPYNSWPAFVIPCFELTILFASLSGVFGMLALNGLPMPYHPVFNVDRFAAASRDKFFLCLEAADPMFDRIRSEQFLADLKPEFITEVPH